MTGSGLVEDDVRSARRPNVTGGITTDRRPLAIVSVHASPLAALGSQENGGMNVYVRAVCEELSRHGVPTEVFTRRTDHAGPDRVRLADLSWVTRIQAGDPAASAKEDLFDLLPAFTQAVLAEQERRGVDYQLIHSHYWLSGWVARQLKAEWRVPWFHTAHTLARVKNERAAAGSLPEPEHRIAVEQAVVRDSDRLVASTMAEAEDLIRLYGADWSHLTVVPPGVSLKMFGPRPTRELRLRLGLLDTRVILFAGRLERLKGAETLLEAFALLQRRPPVSQPTALIVIGDDSHNGAIESRADGGERRRLEALAAQLGIAGSVRFMGAVAQGALATYLSLADVCVVPSYTESFGLVALEAAACGTPVVAARVGGLPAIVKDGLTGYTIPGHQPALYAERIGQLLQDDELHRCFSRRSRMVATQFSWERTVERLLE
ncbi:MAG TPA: glycosyltransferase [Candidatus Limnocylindria bacterium]|nr:glycosyltransferase [Candidatus Limnocylindria bacterium]